MTKAQRKEHKIGNAKRRLRILLKIRAGGPSANYWATCIGVDQCGKYSRA